MNRFSKYQGAGNDFVLIDDRDEMLQLSQSQVARICDRHFGIGADGLILLRNTQDADYEMVYHNADGAIGSMCGNGARCTYAFARDLKVVGEQASFIAYDGIHRGWQHGDKIAISMSDVTGVEFDGEGYILDTGSPHYVKFVDDLARINVLQDGREIRNSPRFRENGINVNFVKTQKGYLRVSTYERGVEDRTLACGTGVTAVSLVYALKYGIDSGPVDLQADGGRLQVNFDREGDRFTGIVLSGPAEKVYDGHWYG